jgi:hypothetical protein
MNTWKYLDAISFHHGSCLTGQDKHKKIMVGEDGGEEEA